MIAVLFALPQSLPLTGASDAATIVVGVAVALVFALLAVRFRSR